MITENNISAQERLVKLREEDKTNAIEMAQIQIDQTLENITNLEKSIEESQELYNSLCEKESSLGNYEKVTEARNELGKNITELETSIRLVKSKLKGLDGEVCPACKQKIDENHVAHIQSEVNSEVDAYQVDLDKAKTRYQKVDDLYNQLREVKSEVSSASNNTANLKSKLGSENNTLKLLYSGLEEIKNKKPTEDLFNLEQLNEELRSLRELYDNISAKSEVVKKAIKYLGDDGIKAKLISKYIPIINTLVNKYLESMDLFVQFELDEQFNETIRARYKDNYSFESFSEGEKLRINLALLLTWRHIAKLRNSVSTNLMVYDEVLDGSFDADGVIDFMKLLGDAGSQNAFIISHNPDVKDMGFDNVIQAEKVGHFTEYNKI